MNPGCGMNDDIDRLHCMSEIRIRTEVADHDGLDLTGQNVVGAANCPTHGELPPAEQLVC
jgi:hypothetical protein